MKSASWINLVLNGEREKNLIGPSLSGASNFLREVWTQPGAPVMERTSQVGEVGYRSAFRKRRLSPERKRLLDALHFEWNPIPAAWEKAFQQLSEYKNRFGDCKVPPHAPGNLYLSGWVRWHRNRGKLLPAERIKRLNSIGFDWNPQASLWEKHYHELKEFRKKHGHCLVPPDWRENPKLGGWVRHTRQRRAHLPIDRKRRLDEIGFDWFPEKTAWQEQINDLIEYQRKHGHCNPTRWSDGNLGRWVNDVRQRRLKRKLTHDKIAQLTAMGFRWDTKSPTRQKRR